MLELLIGGYVLVWWLIFKRFKLLPINLWSNVTTVFIALVAFVVLYTLLSRYQPMTHGARTYAVVTPIISEVQGRVIEVAAEGRTPLVEGDVLFRVDPTPYQAAVDSLQAQLGLAETRLEQEVSLTEQGAGNQGDMDRAQAEADRLRADLAAAQFRLERTVVRAPADGYVTQVVIRPGQFVMPMAFSQVMVFVHAEGPYVVAGFSQNAIEFIDEGDGAEVTFDAIPGNTFEARVVAIQPILSSGTISASGSLKSFDDGVKRGRVPVLLELVGETGDRPLPAGSGAIATVFTGKMHHADLVRRVIIRIKSWENFLPLH